MLQLATFLAFSMFAFLTPASAETRRIVGEKEGIPFEYTAVLQPNEDVLIRGVYLDTSERFRLTVNRKGRVNGKVAGWPTGFGVGQAKRDALVARLKADAAVASGQGATGR